jgi:glutathione S-transferase
MYKLHCFSQSGNAYKVAVLLQALRQPWTPVHLPFADFVAGTVRSDAWRRTSTRWVKSVLEVDTRN